MLIFQPPVNFCPYENIQPSFVVKFWDMITYIATIYSMNQLWGISEFFLDATQNTNSTYRKTVKTKLTILKAMQSWINVLIFFKLQI
jgi:hypothetical protein